MRVRRAEAPISFLANADKKRLRGRPQQPFRGVLDKRRALTCRTESCHLALQRQLLLALVQSHSLESL